MREIREVIYEKSDYDNAKNMTGEEISKILNEIACGLIPHSDYHGQEGYEGSEEDFNNYRMYIALRKAIKKLAPPIVQTKKDDKADTEPYNKCKFCVPSCREECYNCDN